LAIAIGDVDLVSNDNRGLGDEIRGLKSKECEHTYTINEENDEKGDLPPNRIAIELELLGAVIDEQKAIGRIDSGNLIDRELSQTRRTNQIIQYSMNLFDGIAWQDGRGNKPDGESRKRFIKDNLH